MGVRRRRRKERKGGAKSPKYVNIRIPDHIPQPGGPRTLPHDVKIRA